VYSRATTSEMADRPFFGLGVVAFGVVEDLSFGIVNAAYSVSKPFPRLGQDEGREIGNAAAISEFQEMRGI
jgi:hypothetical protein